VLETSTPESLHERAQGRIDEELLRQVIHDVGTALTIIQLNAALLSRQRSRISASISEEQMRELGLDREQAIVEQIIQQARQIETLMQTLSETAPRHDDD